MCGVCPGRGTVGASFATDILWDVCLPINDAFGGKFVNFLGHCLKDLAEAFAIVWRGAACLGPREADPGNSSAILRPEASPGLDTCGLSRPICTQCIPLRGWSNKHDVHRMVCSSVCRIAEWYAGDQTFFLPMIEWSPRFDPVVRNAPWEFKGANSLMFLMPNKLWPMHDTADQRL